MKHRPTLILFCGLPGSGKTTLARKLEKEGRGVRLNTDEWMADLGMDLTDEEQHNKSQAHLWKVARDLLRNGQNVILENGLWMLHERDDKRREAKELDVETELHYLNVPLDELIKRLNARLAYKLHGAAPVTTEQIKSFANLFEAPDKEEQKLYTKVYIHSA